MLPDRLGALVQPGQNARMQSVKESHAPRFGFQGTQRAQHLSVVLQQHACFLIG